MSGHSSAAPLLITADEALTGDLLRLAAGAGATLEVRREAATAMVLWPRAPVVLVGDDQVDAVVALGPTRREAVHVVASGPAADDTFRSAVGVGATSVIELPGDRDRLADLLRDALDDRRHVGVTVAVCGGGGGAGATVLTAALALTAARSTSTMLVDLDALGPGQRRIVGVDDTGGLTWRDLADTRGRLGARSLREALPTRSGVGVLGWPEEPMTPPARHVVREVVAAGQRGHDWVFLDTPRATLVEDGPGAADRVVLVVRATVASVASAARVVDALRGHAGDLAAPGVVVHRSRGSLAAGAVAAALGLPLLAELGHQRRLDEHLDLGLGPVHQRRGPVAAAAARLLDQLTAP